MKLKFWAEFFGTGFLLMVVVGSGIMGENLAQGNAALALLANSLATGAGLFVLIQCLGPFSGAHFNPVVSLVERLRGHLTRQGLTAYVTAQVGGAIAGVWMTHAMFGRDVFQISSKVRLAPNLWLSEVVATFGLISTIGLVGRRKAESVPVCVASYVMAAYWFTSSTAFGNPAVTIARMLTDTFCGIAPLGVVPFLLAQFVGARLAYAMLKRIQVLWKGSERETN